MYIEVNEAGRSTHVELAKSHGLNREWPYLHWLRGKAGPEDQLLWLAFIAKGAHIPTRRKGCPDSEDRADSEEASPPWDSVSGGKLPFSFFVEDKVDSSWDWTRSRCTRSLAGNGLGFGPN